MAKTSLLATKPAEFQQKIKEAPLLPGCYLYKNGRGKILYIGKAKVIRNRVKSYFSNYARLETRIQSMLQQAVRIDFMTTDSEVEALILESNLIKKYKPKYNSMLVDDKSYVYVKFPRLQATGPDEAAVIPTIQVIREKDDPHAVYYGPYPDSRAVKRLLQRTRKIFPYCTSKIRVEIPAKSNELIRSKHRPCFYYQIHLCNGACGGLVTRGEYVHNLRQIERLFKGEKSQLVAELQSSMKKAAQAQQYEDAAKYRNMLRDIQYVGANINIDKDTDELMVMQEKQEKRLRSVDDLVSFLAFPKEKLNNHKSFRIECYDISNIQGRYAVGSMVVNIDGEMQPSLYRRFRIKMKNEPNDFAMMQEMLTRRFKQLLFSQRYAEAIAQGEIDFDLPKDLLGRAKNWQPDESFSQLPDLIIVDGGKGQLSAAYKILNSFQLTEQIPIVGLAKREEDIFKVNDQFADFDKEEWEQPKIADDNFTKVHLPRMSEALYLVQRIRDEAHRFAITYHRKVRSKAFTEL